MVNRIVLAFVTAILVLTVITAHNSSVAQDSSPGSATPEPCAWPLKLVDSELLPRANEEYNELLKATPGLACAQDGFITTSLALTPTPPSTPGPFDAAIKLNEAGQTDEATKSMVSVISQDPTLPIPPELSNLTGEPWNDWRDGSVSFRTWFKAMSAEAETIATDLLKAVVAGIALWIILNQLWRRIFSPVPKPAHIDIGVFETDSENSKLGSLLTESIQAAFGQTKNAHVGSSAKLVAEAEPESKTDATVELLTIPGNQYLALFNFLKIRPQHVYVLTGRTTHDPFKGAGLILALQYGNDIVETETLWGKEFLCQQPKKGETTAAESDVLALAEAAGIWLYATLAKRDKSSNTAPRASTESTDLWTQWTEWKSYALFRSAQNRFEENHHAEAISLLHSSLSIDKGFLPARMNLLTLEMQSRESNLKNDTERRLFYKNYRTRYLQLWNGWGKAVWSEQKGQDENDLAIAAKLLFNLLASSDYARGWDKSPTQELGDGLAESLNNVIKNANTPELSTIGESLNLMRAGLSHRFTDVVPSDGASDHYSKDFFPEGKGRYVFGLRNLYGMACLSVTIGWTKVDGSEDQTTLYREAIAYLRECKAIEPTVFTRRAKTDHSLAPLRTSSVKEEFQQLFEETDNDA